MLFNWIIGTAFIALLIVAPLAYRYIFCRDDSSSLDLNTLIGSQAIVVGSPLSENEIGKVRWSKRYLAAKCHSSSSELSLKADSRVEIIEVREDIVYVKAI